MPRGQFPVGVSLVSPQMTSLGGGYNHGVQRDGRPPTIWPFPGYTNAWLTHYADAQCIPRGSPIRLPARAPERALIGATAGPAGPVCGADASSWAVANPPRPVAGPMTYVWEIGARWRYGRGTRSRLRTHRDLGTAQPVTRRLPPDGDLHGTRRWFGHEHAP